MKGFLFFVGLVVAAGASAQPGLEEIIAAERSFARYSATHGAKEAFVKFLDTGAIMFNKAAPMNGYQFWKAQPQPGFLLNWWPTHAEIAASNDWGWTAGPWTMVLKGADTIQATGYFFTVWAKKAGEWKVILDVGTEEGPIKVDTTVTRWRLEKSANTAYTLVDAESELHQQFLIDSAKAYASFSQPYTVFARERRMLLQGATTYGSSLKVGGKLIFQQQGHGLSPSGDLGYTFGTVELNGRRETYLRFWRHLHNGWKLALEMLRI